MILGLTTLTVTAAQALTAFAEGVTLTVTIYSIGKGVKNTARGGRKR